METYFDKQEDRCEKLFRDFNNQVHWFQGITANTRGSEIDFKCTDKIGRLVHIELKERKGNIKKFNGFGDILLEPSKLAAFTRIAESGHTYNEQRLYINFVDDGVIIFNIDEIHNMRFYPNHQQINFGKKILEREDRLGLSMEDAIIYTKDGTRIQ
jgi:hypothetical protein